MTTPTILCAGHDEPAFPAVAVLVYLGQDTTIGAGLCASCATCSDPTCPDLGTVMEAEYEEPWCTAHAESYGAEAVHGPDIVLIDSDRYRTLTGQATR